jgi:hypothetical protein
MALWYFLAASYSMKMDYYDCFRFICTNIY